MALDNLTGEITVFKRDETKRKYLRDYAIRNPGAGTGTGSLPDIDASVMADTLAPLYANAVTIGNNVASSTKTGQALIDEAGRLGTAPLPAIGASGFVAIGASVGGTHIFVGDEIKVNGNRYQCTAESVYFDKSPVPITGVDVGPATNVDAGVVMKWTSPRPGCQQQATIVAQSDGTGLSGGRPVEDDAALNARLISLRASPPASGNDAEYQAAVMKTPGLSIQAPFSFPAIAGPGSIGVIFTMRPAVPGANRTPTAPQIAAVFAWLTGLFPAGDGIFVGAVVPQPVNVALKVTWAVGAPGWADAVQWPQYANPMAQVKASPAPTATTFRVTNVATAPQAGQTIGFYDSTAAKYRRKRILTGTFVAGSDYDIVVDTSNNASDTAYTPTATQPCCPWSDSLDTLPTPVIAYFDLLGPGEQTSGFDAGLRQRRSPRDPQYWPSTITTRLLTGVFALPTVQDTTLQEPATPYAPTVGTPGVSSNLTTLATLVAFP